MKIAHRLDLKHLKKALLKALVARRKKKVDGDSDETLSFLLLVQERYKRNHELQPNNPMALRLAAHQTIDAALKVLNFHDQKGADVIKRYYVDKEAEDKTANRLNWNRHKVRRYRDKAILRLAETIYQQEQGRRQQVALQLERLLPPKPYTRLFGRENDIAMVVDRMLQSDHTWVTTLTGVGGIGKTSMAHAVVSKLITHFFFDEIVWLTVGSASPYTHSLPPDVTFETLITQLFQVLYPHETVPSDFERRQQRVQRRLLSAHYLVVIDNLEVKADTAYLLMHIGNLTNPSKFLITSRVQPPRQGNTFIYPLRELDETAALSLLREHAQTIGHMGLMQVTSDDLRYAHTFVGGNPHALRLVAELADTQPLPQVLLGLQKGWTGDVEALYERIYTELWRTLSQDARALLQVMALIAATGTSPEHLQAISGLDAGRLWPAITELVNRSMLEVRQYAQMASYVYSIHRLTETFLQARQNGLTGEAQNAFYTIFAQRILANILYWQQKLTSMAEAHLVSSDHLLTTHRLNVVRAVQIGLTQPTTHEQTILFMDQLFPVVEHSGYWREWMPLFEQAAAVSDTPDLQLLRLEMLIRLGQLLRLNRQTEAAIACHQEVEQRALQLGAERPLALANANLSADWRQKHDYDKAEAHGLAALTVFNQLQLSDRITATLNTLGLIAQDKGDLETAELRLCEAIELGRTIDDPTNLARSIQNLGITLHNQARYDEALQLFEEAWTVLQPTGSEIDKVRVQLNMASTYYKQERYDEAQSTYEQLEEMIEGRPMISPYFHALVAVSLGNVLLKQGQLGRATDYLQRSQQLWQQQNDSLMLANALGVLAEAFQLQGKKRDAQRKYDEAIGLLQKYGQNAWANQLLAEFEAAREVLVPVS